MKRAKSPKPKRRLAIFALLFLPAFLPLGCDDARASVDPELTWRLGGGASIPVSPDRFEEVHSFGLNLQVGVGVSLPGGLRVVAAYDFNRMFVDEAGVTNYIKSLDPTHDPGDPVDSNPTGIHTLMAVAVYAFGPSPVARAYVLGGLGWMWLRPGDISYEGGQLGGSNESAFATTLGAGVEFSLSYTLNAFVEAAWTVGFTPDDATQFVPVRFGICR
jgi:hypothetical protein